MPPTPPQKRRGAPRKKGALIGSPKTLTKTTTGWAPHPSEAGTEVQAWCGLWHSVLPGQLIRVVVVRRDATRCLNTPGQRKPLPVVEAFFTTDLTLSLDAILREYRDRWAVEIAIRDANAFDGLGQEQCRQWHRIVRANTLRLVKPHRAPAFGPARHWRFAGGAFTPPLTKGMLTPPWNPSIRFPALTGGA